MLSLLRQFYRYCIQAGYEGIRNHKAVLDLLENIHKSGNLLDRGCTNYEKEQDCFTQRSDAGPLEPEKRLDLTMLEQF